MTKKQTIYILIAAILLSQLFNIFFGRWLAAKISTLPLLSRYKLVSPQGSIVINTRQEVRVTDSGDVQQALASVRPKLSLLISDSGGQVAVLGGALNLTSDGLFVTLKSAVDGQKISNLKLKLDDGTLAQVTKIYSDNATDLVILKCALQNVPVVDFASSKDAVLGQRVVLVLPQLANFAATFEAAFISQTQGGLTEKNADAPSRTFIVQNTDNLAPGTAVIDTNGSVLGLWDGGRIVSVDVIRDLDNIYLNNQGQIIRPQFGFSFKMVSQAEAQVLGTAVGAKIISLTSGETAQKAGFMINDVITSWGQTDINDTSSLEAALAGAKPGDNISVKITRGKTQMVITLTVGQLK